MQQKEKLITLKQPKMNPFKEKKTVHFHVSERVSLRKQEKRYKLALYRFVVLTKIVCIVLSWNTVSFCVDFFETVSVCVFRCIV